ncbi:hypothetical protein G3A_14980 [Bacillus sp. 17376]|nr:hypothetical protein G3A_14980 [Bacillus sp. 17376]
MNYYKTLIGWREGGFGTAIIPALFLKKGKRSQNR